MRNAAFLIFAANAFLASAATATTCVAVSPSRHHWFDRSEVIAKARYAGDNIFIVEEVLFSVGGRPRTIELPKAGAALTCSDSEKKPTAGEAYLVAVRSCAQRPCPVLWRPISLHADDLRYIRDRRVMTARELLEAFSEVVSGGMSIDAFRAIIAVAGTNEEFGTAMPHVVLDEIEELLFIAEETSRCSGFDEAWYRAPEMQNAAAAALAALPAVENEEQYLDWQEIHDPNAETPAWSDHVEKMKQSFFEVFPRYDAARPCAAFPDNGGVTPGP